MSKTSQASDWLLYRRLLGYVLPYWPFFLLSISGFWLFSFAQIALADLFQFIVDSIAGDVNGKRGMVTAIISQLEGGFIDPGNVRNWIVGSIFVLGFLRGLGFFVGNYFISYIARYLVHNLRLAVFDHLLVAPSREYDDSSSGHLISRVVYNVEQVTGAATDALKVVIREGIFATGIVIYLMITNWQLSIFFLLTIPFIAWMVNVVGRKFRKVSKRMQGSMGEVTQSSREAINAYKEVRIFGGKQVERERFFQASENNRRQAMRMVLYNSIAPPIIQQPIVIVLAGMIWFALGYFEQMSPGEFIAYLGVALLLPKPLRQLSEVYSIIQKGLAAAEDIFGFIDGEQEQDTGSYRADSVRGQIDFQDVSFRYQPDGEDVLKNISFSVSPGQTIALVGLSGSGKSTIVNLLARFYNHDRGRILLDGVDVNDYELANLRHHIAIVGQHVTLFNDTVLNNIAYGEMNAVPFDNVVAAAETANALSFIESLPNGFDTFTGDDGSKLSGGQRQRIAIARALLKNAPVLILDEATSALDNRAEHYIQEALGSVMKGRTTIVVAHRLSTIENADRILVLDKGEIVQSGTHETLLAEGGLYGELYHKQFSEDAD